MSINYEPLWKFLDQKGLKKKDLIELAHISHSSVAKLAKNQTISTSVLNKICKGLNCSLTDIMSYDSLTMVQPKKLAKPFVKWAGGKTQLLDYLIPLIPNYLGKYIEPFLGGGALFFALQPESAILSDSNPDLVNAYQQVKTNVDKLIEELKLLKNDETEFYRIRSIQPAELTPVKAAARFIYLNKTCFNGLYRVNRKGQFNVPFGHYKNPKIVDEETLRTASKALQKAEIVCGDYKEILAKYAEPDDFIFLDPPYVPVGKYSDFKRYTKEQFNESDQTELADVFKELAKSDIYSILTNSNAELVHELYDDFDMEIISTHRHISSKGDKRQGEDVIVTNFQSVPNTPCSVQVKNYPSTRFMGSKRKLLKNIWNAASLFKYDSVLDLFSGSGVVSYLFKANGKTVFSNDYMRMCCTFSKAMVENNHVTLSQSKAKELMKPVKNDSFVETTFKGLYFSDHENELIDFIRTNIMALSDEYERAIAMTALIRACMKKRPRGLFTYVGQRYDDGRKDLKKSFEEQFLENVVAVNDAVYNNGKNNRSYNQDSLSLRLNTPDLVYIDPPYYTPKSDNEYVRRYHFVEGLARNWEGVDVQYDTKTKKFKSYPTPFAKKDSAKQAFEELFNQYADSILIVSYSSNSLPNRYEMVSLLKNIKQTVKVLPIEYRYSFGNQVKESRSKVKEYLFVAY